MGSRAARGADVTPALQAFALRQIMPDGRARIRKGELTWVGEVQPSSECSAYELHIVHRPRRLPTVRVLSPALKPNEEGLLPHVYDDGTLCLHEDEGWRPSMLLSQTLLPWACEWLFYYELWLASEIWFGDGPDRLDPASQARILHPYG
jgi:hypothetical protein